MSTIENNKQILRNYELSALKDKEINGFNQYLDNVRLSSHTAPYDKADKQSVDLFEKTIKLPKLGLVDCKVSKQIEGRILSTSVLQVPSGKYYVSLCCTDYGPQALEKTGAIVGIRMGIQTLVTTSDGKQFENNRYSETSRKKACLPSACGVPKTKGRPKPRKGKNQASPRIRADIEAKDRRHA